MEDIISRVAYLILTISLALLSIKFYNEKNKLKQEFKSENEGKDDLIKELEIELAFHKKENENSKLLLDEKDVEIQKLREFSKNIEQAFLEKKQEMNAKYDYLSNFLNNGVFYDKQNNTIVLIQELIRLGDLEDEEQEIESSSKEA